MRGVRAQHRALRRTAAAMLTTIALLCLVVLHVFVQHRYGAVVRMMRDRADAAESRARGLNEDLRACAKQRDQLLAKQQEDFVTLQSFAGIWEDRRGRLLVITGADGLRVMETDGRVH